MSDGEGEREEHSRRGQVASPASDVLDLSSMTINVRPYLDGLSVEWDRLMVTTRDPSWQCLKTVRVYLRRWRGGRRVYWFWLFP